MQTDGFFTGSEPTTSKEPEVDIGDSGDILLPKPVTPQPGLGRNDRRKEGKSKREQEEEEREKMQYVLDEAQHLSEAATLDKTKHWILVS